MIPSPEMHTIVPTPKPSKAPNPVHPLPLSGELGEPELHGWIPMKLGRYFPSRYPLVETR